MRELSINEVDEVSGGNANLAAFLIGLAVTFARDAYDAAVANGPPSFGTDPGGSGVGACPGSCHGG